jgi:tetratricopeptide (TPR) repeat protein
MHRGQLGEATALMELAQASAARASDFAAETECCRASFMLAYHAGDMERCVALAERLLAIGVEIGDRYSEAAAQLRIGIAWLAARREIARTREKFATAIAIYEELGYQAGIASVLHNRSMLENEIGNFAGAIADTERALEMFRALGDNRAIATALGNLGQMRAVAGDVAQACEDAKAARELAHASAYHIQEACAIENLAAAVAASGDLGEAIRLGNEALAHHRNAETANWSGRLLADLAVWYMLSGDLESARARVDEMLAQRVPMATESSQRFYWATARVLRACGEEAMAKRELTRARELVAELTVELSDEERERFEAVAWNREIIAAFDRDDWP